MWRKLLVVMVAGVMILPFVACDNDTPTVEEILEGMVAAADGINTLNYELNTEAAIEAEIYTMGFDMEAVPQEMNINAAISSSGVIDKENRQMRMDANASYSLSGAEGSVGEMSYEMALAVYVVDNSGYIMMDIPLTGASWQKYSLTLEELQQIEDMFAGQDTAASPQELLEVADVTIEGSEKIKGVDCYLLNLTPDAEKIWQRADEMAQEAGEAIPTEFDREILDRIISGISIEMWVAKDTYYAAKIQMAMDMELTAEDMGGIAENQTLESLKINASYDMQMYDYNKSVTITLPPEAENAVEMPVSSIGIPVYSYEQEALDTEYANIQTAVMAMMFDAEVTELDDSYTGIDTLAEVHAVTAGGGEYHLDGYLVYSEYPLMQTYDIYMDGWVDIALPVPDVTVIIPSTVTS